jgi:hypothetical protein
MGERRRAHARYRARRARRLRGQRRGVVAVVGTLLALLVFFSLFGVFLTQYVPLWMEQDESQFSNQVQTSLATLKSGVDDQVVLGDIPLYSVPFTLSSQSVPLFAQPTLATLSYLAGCPGGFATNGTPEEVGTCTFERLSYGSGTATAYNHPYQAQFTTDFLEVTLPDRYYVPVSYYFEDDGVSEAQSSSHQWMLVPPPFNVTKTGTTIDVATSLVVLDGPAGSLSGQGSKDVSSTYVAGTNVSSTDRFTTVSGALRTFNLTMTFGVHNICAWYNLLYNVTTTALGSAAAGVWTLTGSWGIGSPLVAAPSASVCASSVSTTYDITLEIYGVSYASTLVGQAALSFNAGGL